MTDWKEMVTADPEAMVGKPVIAGTRLRVGCRHEIINRPGLKNIGAALCLRTPF
jgi:hypothetical protein